MPRMMEKKELIKSVVEASQFDSFWLDTIHSSGGRAWVSFPEGMSSCDVQVVYIPIEKRGEQSSAKSRLHALMARTPKQPGAPYEFRRADAYEEELA